jgi:Flp pilus assembly protein TadG
MRVLGGVVNKSPKICGVFPINLSRFTRGFCHYPPTLEARDAGESMSKFVRSQLKDFRSDARGAIALLTGLVLIMMAIGAGTAIDFVRGSRQRLALNAAIDAAALAVAASSKTDEAELEQLALDYINANYNSLKYPGTSLDLDVVVTEDAVQITAHQQMPTTVMRIANIDTMDLQAFTEATRGATALEVVLVLDNTGSMNSGGKLTSLKTAATDLTELLFGEVTESSTVKIGIVPFSMAVDVGPQYSDATWIDHTGLNTISHLNFTDGTKHNSWAWGQLANMDWNGCVEQRKVASGIDYDVDDTTPDTGTPDTLFPVYFAPDEPSNTNNASSRTGYGSGFVNSYLADWKSTESVSSTTKSNTSLDERQRRYQKYVGTSATGDGPAFLCDLSPITPLTGTKQNILDAITAMIADGGTNIASGVGWGLRVLSPSIPFTEGAAYDDEDWNKVMIIMTDGENDWGPSLTNMNGSYYSGYGYRSQSSTRLGVSTITDMDGVFDARTAQACNEAKAASTDPDKPILIYTITFGTLSSDTEDLMRDCASSPDNYFNAPTNEQLQAVFEQIGTEISELYLSK